MAFFRHDGRSPAQIQCSSAPLVGLRRKRELEKVVLVLQLPHSCCWRTLLLEDAVAGGRGLTAPLNVLSPLLPLRLLAHDDAKAKVMHLNRGVWTILWMVHGFCERIRRCDKLQR